jgi:hypothetical protein
MNPIQATRGEERESPTEYQGELSGDWKVAKKVHESVTE